MLVKTYVAPSSIHGMGLFANEDILKGTEVWKWMDGIDVVIPDWKYNVLHPTIQEHIQHYAWFEDGLYFLCADNGKFANHSETPNLDSDGKSDIVLRDIKKGEELTYNYWKFHKGDKL